MLKAVPVRVMTPDDADWAARLMAARREIYAVYSPVFWRPRPGVEAQHTAFLRHQLDSPATTAVRTDRGFLIAQRRVGVVLIDDFAVDADGRWPTEGRELLNSAWQLLRERADATRVVTAMADEPKSEMLRAAGLKLVEQWWVKPIEPAPTSEASTPARVSGRGFAGVLGPAPPVYDPGGLILLADEVPDAAELIAVEDDAARLGAVLVVLPRPPGHRHEAALLERGWTVASQWYHGQPRE